MADAGTIIVQFDALQNAITSFKQTSGEIDALAASLQSCAGTLAQGHVGPDADIFAGKVTNLISNFKKATEMLNQEGLELQQKYDLEWEAEKQAEQIAESVSDYNI